MGKKKQGAWKNFYQKRALAKTTEKNKVKRTLRSQGLKAAVSLAKKFGVSTFLSTLTKGTIDDE